MKINFPYLYTSKTSFNGLSRVDKNSERSIDSAFFREPDSLLKAVEILRTNFPNGAQILDYAASDGEEALSIAMLLDNDKRKFPIVALDISQDAKELYDSGIYSVFPRYHDSYLLKTAKRTEKEAQLAKTFYKNMVGTKPPFEPINNSPTFYCTVLPYINESQITYFTPKKDIKSTINYEIGDIQDISEIKTNKEVGAIFFRNAFYHLLGNFDGDTLNDNAFEEYKGMQINTPDEKVKIVNEVIDKIYDKLSPGGVFVIGSSPNEVIFIAPDDAPEDEIIYYSDTIQYKSAMKKLNDEYARFLNGSAYFKKDIMQGISDEMHSYKKSAAIKLYKKSIIQMALERDDRFEPVCWAMAQLPVVDNQKSTYCLGKKSVAMKIGNIYQGIKTQFIIRDKSPLSIVRHLGLMVKDPVAQMFGISNRKGYILEKYAELSDIQIINRKTSQKVDAKIMKYLFENDFQRHSIKKGGETLAYVDSALDDDCIFLEYLYNIQGRKRYRALEKLVVQAMVEDFINQKHEIPEIAAAARRIGRLKFDRGALYKYMGAEVFQYSPVEFDKNYLEIYCSKDTLIKELNKIAQKDSFLLPQTKENFEKIIN